MRHVLLVTSCFALMLTGCTHGGGSGALEAERNERIGGVTAETRGASTSLFVDAGCLDKGRLVVEEQSERLVSLRYFLRRWNSNGDPVPACGSRTVVTLIAPLGDRAVMDAETGNLVEVFGLR